MTEECRKDRQVEILAPAGSFACFQAAMNAGADAVYAGRSTFWSKSISQNNFTQDELIEAIERGSYLWRRSFI